MDAKKRILLLNVHYIHRRGFLSRLMAKFLTNPLLTLPYVAASIPEDKYNVIAVDDAYEDPDFNEYFDLVGISTVTPAAPRAYKMADRFRENGMKVIMGGLHPSAMPYEAIEHADSVVIGEAETNMPKLLADFEKGKLKKFYKSKKRIEGDDAVFPNRRVYKIEPLAAAVQTSRGCPYGCEFCILTSIHGRKYRPFSIDRIIEDVKKSKRKLIIMLHDSSLTISPSYAKSLFRRLKPLKKKIICYGSIPVLYRDDEILKLASQAGCVFWALGFETVKQSNLNIKRGHKIEMYRHLINKIKKYDMGVFGSFIFGFDNDDTSVFDYTWDTINEWDLDGAEFNILTPFPGTPLYNKLSMENRILTRDWSKYNLREVVFLPKRMDPQELKAGVDRISRKFYSVNNVIKRIFPYFFKMDLAKLIFVSGLNTSMVAFHFFS